MSPDDNSLYLELDHLSDLDVVKATPWTELEECLLKLTPVPQLYIRFYDKDAFKWLLRSVLDGRILGQILAMGQEVPLLAFGRAEAGLPDENGHCGIVLHKDSDITMHDILSAPHQHVVDGHEVYLEDPIQRFEYLSCPSPRTKLVYLRHVLAADPNMSSCTFAQDLPPEVVHGILDASRQEGVWDVLERPSKKGLVSLSLTCYYWATLIRRSLFASLTLHGREDLLQLIKFLHCPEVLPIPLKACIHRIEVIQDNPREAPWLHLLAKLPYMSEGVGNAFIIKGLESEPDSSASETPKPDHLPLALLPRTVPGSIFNIHRLLLRDLRLRRRMDLARFVDGLPRLWTCELIRVTFVEEGGSMERPHRRRFNPLYELRWVRAGNCEDRSLHSQILLSSGVLRVRARLGLTDNPGC